jgi:hypothetical protein
MRHSQTGSQTRADLHVITLVCLMLKQAANYGAVHNSL